ncbi:MAG: GNAT family N-acetyltransferase [Legionella sp.]|jgi:ribosomal protein S18 acetylase RimI-like enzyme
MNCEIQIVDTISEEDEKIMRNDLIAYEHSHGVDVNFHPFAFVLKSESKKTVGILNGFTAFSEIYVDDMWVSKAHRGKGYGRKLLDYLYKHFEGKGYNNINLVTNQFQARGFYEKCGFEVEFVRKNIKNPQLSKIFLIKYFNEAVETQGLYKD